MSNQVTIIKQPLYGTVDWDGIKFNYIPKRGFSGTDYYVYSITDGLTAQIKTNYIDSTNLPPSAADITMDVDAADITLINVNNYSNDPDTLIFNIKIIEVTKPLYGIASYNDDNIISYQSYGFNAKDVFTYTISDGEYNSTGKIELNIKNGVNSQIPDFILSSLSTLEADYNVITEESIGWNSSFTLLCSKSAAWDAINPERYNAVSNLVESYSADWNSMGDNKDAYVTAYNLIQSKSGDWNNTINKIDTITTIYSSDSAKWESSYTLLSGSSSTWDTNVQNTTALASLYNNNSGNWQATYVLVSGSSALWDKTLLTNLLSSNSGNWVNSYNILCANSSKWDDSYSNINSIFSVFSANSADWSNTYSLVCSNSAEWDTRLITAYLTAHSGDWETAYSLVCSGSSDWYNNITNFTALSTDYNSNSGDWNSVYNTVCASSSTWDTTPLFTYLSTYSGDWYSAYSIVNSGSSYWNNLIGYFNTLSTDYNSNSGNWNSVYNTVCATSSNWDITDINLFLSANSSYWNATYNTLTANSGAWGTLGPLFNSLSSDYNANSGYWDTVYTYVTANSSLWDVSDVYSLIESSTGNWDTANTLVTANSASWAGLTNNFNNLSTNYNTNSGKWNSTYNLVTANSAGWDYSSIATTVSLNSADWIVTYTVLTANSSKWSTGYNKLTSLSSDYAASSGTCQTTYNTVCGSSGSWGDMTAFTTVTSNSGKWNSVYNTVCASSSTWNNLSSFYSKYDIAYNLLSTTSSDWNVTYNTLTSTSGKWEGVYTTVNTNSAKWLSGGTDVNITANNLIVSGNAVFYGSLTAEGETTQLNTEIVATSSFAVVNTGFVDALHVTKTQTTGAIADFNTNGSSVLYVSPLNKVGINTNAPTEALTVVGNISASGVIYAAIPAQYTTFSNNSGKYENAYTYVSQTSSAINALTGAKSSYDTAYTYMTANSSSFNALSLSASNYTNAFNIVSAQSGANYSSYTFLTGNSGSVGKDTVYRSVSSYYESASNYVAAITSTSAQINFIFDGGGEPVNAVAIGMVQIPYKFKITSWNMLADVPTTASVQVLSSDYGSYPSTVIISGNANAPVLAAATKSTNSSTLTDWLTSLNADTILKFRLINNSAATSITLSIKGSKLI